MKHRRWLPAIGLIILIVAAPALAFGGGEGDGADCDEDTDCEGEQTQQVALVTIEEAITPTLQDPARRNPPSRRHNAPPRDTGCREWYFVRDYQLVTLSDGSKRLLPYMRPASRPCRW